jgi:probable phosphoglycerate mutase
VIRPPGPRVVLVRHGQTEWSRDGRHTGSRSDPPLTDAGREAARALAPRLAGWPFALALTSPLQRAAETARLAGLESVEVEPDLREWDYGDYEGLTTPQIRERAPGWTIWVGGCPGGESIEQVAARVDRVIGRIRADLGPDQTAALVAHGHVLRVLAARWLDAPPDAGRWLALDTASLSGLGWERDTAVLWYWNLTAG